MVRVGGAGIDLFTDQRVRHRVEETVDLNMVVDADAGEAPLSILVVLLWQRLHGRPLDCFEQLASADTQAAHLAAVHPLERHANRGLALRQRKEGNVAQATKDVGLRKTHACLHGSLVLRLPWPCWHHPDIVVCSHLGVAAIYFGIVKRRTC